MMLGILFAQSKHYSDKLSKDVRRGIRAKVHQGWRPGQAPVGYLNDAVNRIIIKDPQRFDLVKRIWKMFLQNVAIASIAFFFTSAFDAVYLAVAIVSGVVLLGLTAKFIAHPSPENAWAGYKFSGIYLALVLIGMMADAILRIPL